MNQSSTKTKSNVKLQSIQHTQVKSTTATLNRKSTSSVKINNNDPEKLRKAIYFEYKKKWNEILKLAKIEFNGAWEKISKNTAKFEDFQFIEMLGSGSFGRVYLATCSFKKYKKFSNEDVKHEEYDENIRYYAVKVLQKEKIVKSKQIEHTICEKKIQSAIKFPFLVSLIASFKTNSNLFIVLEYIKGNEMFSHLVRLGRFTESTVRFYISQIILAIEYLHSLDILHRDLKPENTLICADGYLKLADFGFAKVVKTRTYTLCGTPQYLAPEILRHEGYGKAVDWWAIGILTYELATGFPPFDDPKNQNLMYEKILSGDFKKNPNTKSLSDDLVDFISHLIEIDLTKRYGNLKDGVDDIKLHKWLRNIDWQRIYEKKVQRPKNVIEILKFINDKETKNNFDKELIKIINTITISDSDKEIFVNEFENF